MAGITAGSRIIWVVAAATICVYATMLVWSIPKISAEAGGLPVFDLRPGGYSYAEAQAFLAALSADGKRFYASVQLRLDTAYPALLAVTLAWSILRLAPAGWGVFRPLLAATPVPGMIFDYWENSDVARMLAAGPDGVTPAMVKAASFHSQAKAAATTVSMTVLLVLLAIWAVRRFRGRTAR